MWRVVRNIWALGKEVTGKSGSSLFDITSISISQLARQDFGAYSLPTSARAYHRLQVGVLRPNRVSRPERTYQTAIQRPNGNKTRITQGQVETNNSRRNTWEDRDHHIETLTHIMSRARRDPDTSSRATLSRDPPSSPSNPSLRLTVKMPVSKLRAATGGSSRTGGRSSSAGGRDRFAGGEILESKRARNVKKSYVVESESEEEDEEMEDLGDEDEDAEADEDDDMDLDEDAEGEEDADGDEDTEMAVLPPPILKISKPMKEKHSITVKPAKKDVRVVATTDPSDDEELSDLESDVEEDEETMQVPADEDAEGEDEEIEVEEEDEEEEEEEEDELDSDDEAGGGSRGSTPDLSKLTKRQRARLDESGGGHLLALPDEVQVKKHLTAEEHAMRRAEMARRRKNLSEKRNEEEK
ncbi:hypothetical protein V496_03029, partial [Pseudogymnoascus sp. VKM F-4515 (FW-2607)]